VKKTGPSNTASPDSQPQGKLGAETPSETTTEAREATLSRAKGHANFSPDASFDSMILPVGEDLAVDVMAVGAHPDDVELGAGGLLHKLARLGHRTAILDLTRGEMGSRGSVEERMAEAQAAAAILGVVRRANAGLPDSALSNTHEFRLRVIPFIRAFRPQIVLAPMDNDRHPDHSAAHHLVRDAAYFAGLTRIDTEQEPHRPPIIYFYHPYREEGMPSLIVDVSDDFEAKLEALRAHASQFFNPAYVGPETHISGKAFWESIQTRAAYWGSRIGASYGEAFYAEGSIGVGLLPGLE